MKTCNEAVATIMPTRIFTPTLANKTLPLVRSIVADILAKASELRGLQVLATDPDDEEVQQARQEVGQLMRELEQLGCSFKDWNFDVGLVDFPAEIHGREVFLCWKSDEPTVEWYHPRDGSFADRKPVPSELLDGE